MGGFVAGRMGIMLIPDLTLELNWVVGGGDSGMGLLGLHGRCAVRVFGFRCLIPSFLVDYAASEGSPFTSCLSVCICIHSRSSSVSLFYISVTSSRSNRPQLRSLYILYITLFQFVLRAMRGARRATQHLMVALLPPLCSLPIIDFRLHYISYPLIDSCFFRTHIHEYL